MSTSAIDALVPPWHKYGLCRQTDADTFFPERRDSACVRDAKATCELCPVKALCLDWAMQNPKQEGIAGALLWDERLALLGLTENGVQLEAADEADLIDLRILMARSAVVEAEDDLELVAA